MLGAWPLVLVVHSPILQHSLRICSLLYTVICAGTCISLCVLSSLGDSLPAMTQGWSLDHAYSNQFDGPSLVDKTHYKWGFYLLPLGLNTEGCLSWDSSVETMLSLTWTNSLISHSVLNLALCCQVILIALKTDSNFSSTLILIRRKTFKMDERWYRQQSPHSSISRTQKIIFAFLHGRTDQTWKKEKAEEENEWLQSQAPWQTLGLSCKLHLHGIHDKHREMQCDCEKWEAWEITRHTPWGCISVRKNSHQLYSDTIYCLIASFVFRNTGCVLSEQITSESFFLVLMTSCGVSIIQSFSRPESTRYIPVTMGSGCSLKHHFNATWGVSM